MAAEFAEGPKFGFNIYLANDINPQFRTGKEITHSVALDAL